VVAINTAINWCSQKAATRSHKKQQMVPIGAVMAVWALAQSVVLATAIPNFKNI